MKSKQTYPFKLTQVFPHEVVELDKKDHKVNGNRIKQYIGQREEVKMVMSLYLDLVQ